MASAVSPADLQAEASCPVCLDYLRDPVTIECGHNFCRSCLQQRWTGLHVLPCPVCLHHCPDRSCQRNAQLGHLTDVIKQLDSSRRRRRRPRETALCERHREALVLFCEKDLELLCPQCSVSPAHRRHPLTPAARAAARHRRRLRGHAERLREQVEEAEKGLSVQVSKTFKVRRKMEYCRRELRYECKELKRSLEIEQDEINARLLREEVDAEEKLIKNKRQISNHMFTINNLLREIADKYYETDLDLLTGIESVYHRYEHLKTPEVFSCELNQQMCILPPHYFSLHEMISRFQVELALDPQTAHRSLNISRDRKSVTRRTMTPNCCQNPQPLASYPAVLGSEGFDAGRHFWQVEVRGTGEWCLGVCKESFARNGHVSPSPSNGCWQYQLWTSTCGACPTGRVQVGVFLDYELGEVSFYNLNNRLYLYRFTGIFTERLMPYFSILSSSNSLQISILRDHR